MKRIRRTLGELDPAGAMETMLVEQIVSLSWRRSRAQRIQDHASDYLMAQDASSPYVKLLQSQGDPGNDPELALGRTVAKDFSNARVLNRLLTYERRIESSLYRTVAELQRLRLARELEVAGEAPALLEKTAGCAKHTQCVGSEIKEPCSPESGEQTPYGVTTNGEAPACKTKPVVAHRRERLRAVFRRHYGARGGRIIGGSILNPQQMDGPRTCRAMQAESQER